MTSNSWQTKASCADPKIKIDFHSSNHEEVEKAKALCAACPVKSLCLQNALDSKERFGVWGGADERELRRAQAINEFGEAHVQKKKRIRCPQCGPFSTRFLMVIERKRTRTHISCSNCGLHWWARKAINIKLSNF